MESKLEDFRTIPVSLWVQLQFQYACAGPVTVKIAGPHQYVARKFPFNENCGIAILRAGVVGNFRFVKYGSVEQWRELDNDIARQHSGD